MTCEKPRSTSGSGEERRRGARVGPDEQPHLVDAVAGEPVNERVVGLQRLSVAAENGVFPFRRPAVDANAELLLELYVPASGFENGSDRTEQSVYSGVVARCGERRPQVEDESVGEQRTQRFLVLTDDRLGHLVHCRDVCMLAHVSDGMKPRLGRTSEKQWNFALCRIGNSLHSA